MNAGNADMCRYDKPNSLWQAGQKKAEKSAHFYLLTEQIAVPPHVGAGRVK